MEIDDNITLLIIGRLKNTNSAADEATLEKWLAASANNRSQFQKMQALWRTSEKLSSFPAIDVDQQWQRFQQRHFSKAKSGKLINLRVWQYAAAAILVLSIGISGLYLSGENTYRTYENERLQLTLDDGTYVVLQDNSSLEVPRTFGWFGRDLKLNGAGFFKVAKNPEKPFQIAGPISKTTVLGTRFKLTATKTQNQISVSEGRVAYYLVPAKDTLILTAGESGQHLNSKLIKYAMAHLVDESWLDGIFEFENTGLRQVLDKLQNHYAFNLEADGLNISEDCRFSGRFDKQPLNEVLEELSMVMGMQYQFDENTLTIKSLSCN